VAASSCICVDARRAPQISIHSSFRGSQIGRSLAGHAHPSTLARARRGPTFGCFKVVFSTQKTKKA
jgi:hypothetical protein